MHTEAAKHLRYLPYTVLSFIFLWDQVSCKRHALKPTFNVGGKRTTVVNLIVLHAPNLKSRMGGVTGMERGL